MRRLFALLGLLVAARVAVAEPVWSPAGRVLVVPGPGAQGLAESLAPTADQDRDSVAADLGRDWDGHTEVRVALDEASFRTLLPKGAAVPFWAEGVAFPELNLVVLRGAPGDPRARATLRHEFSHLALGQLGRGVPRWFLEGLATLRAGDAWSRRGPSLVRAALTSHIFHFSELSDGFPAGSSDAELAYAQSADFVSWLVDRNGDEAIHGLLRDMVAGATFEHAFTAHFGAPPQVLELQWSKSLERWELVALLLTQTELWWVLLATVFALAAVRVRARRRELMEQMAREEEMQARLFFARAPAYWADGPDDDEGEPGGQAGDEAETQAPDELDDDPEGEDEPLEGEPPSSAHPGEQVEPADDEIPYFVSHQPPASKKPTLH